MSQGNWHNVWEGVIRAPLATRFQKPRIHGLTMIMDKGLGLSGTLELLSVASRYIDYVKLAFGTSALYDGELLRGKIDLIRSYDVHVYPGGTFFEIAIMQNKLDEFLAKALELNFSAVEISDGTLPVSPETRQKAIRKAADMGFEVLSEVGKKDCLETLSAYAVAEQIKQDLAAGAAKVILEARESGMGIGIFNDQGEIKKDHLAEILADVRDPDVIIWEAPLKKQQQGLILHFGPNVNLGNIPPSEILALESLRVGLRGDTLKSVIKEKLAGCSQ